ncbi:response regulator [Paraburkholderia guartelaensis]|uniref:response regulator n=1 Tax=Paraburkholderia guartelaensis TaxID=2546446 RepID=UPI00140A435F|nr:response regulator [Paraburkholderia guartelaensis]
MANVLLVDDEPENACSLALALEHSGHRVHITGDARAAIDFMRRESIECLITDYQMPDIDGVQLCLMIRACPRLAGTPVLMLSGAPEPVESEWCCSQFFRSRYALKKSSRLLTLMSQRGSRLDCAQGHAGFHFALQCDVGHPPPHDGLR